MSFARLFASLCMLMLASMAAGQEAAPDFHPDRTAWGDPDFRGIWPVQSINDARIPFERPATMGERAWLTEEEFAERLKRAELSDASYSDGIDGDGTRGLADWLRSSRTGHAASLLVDPPDGRLPPLTRAAQALHEAGRSSYKEGQTRFDWITDMDAFDRCITRGFPAMMLPKPYNNGVRIFQSPGYVVLQLEMFGTRVVPVGQDGLWPDAVRAWNGSSRGRWDGDTLVIETTNIVSGDSATADVARRAGSPLPNRTLATLPMGPGAHTLERLTMIGAGTIAYELTYTDPEVFTAPWTAAFEWPRDDDYQFYEYACHEGNGHLRVLIETSRAMGSERRAGRGAE